MLCLLSQLYLYYSRIDLLVKQRNNNTNNTNNNNNNNDEDDVEEDFVGDIDVDERLACDALVRACNVPLPSTTAVSTATSSTSKLTTTSLWRIAGSAARLLVALLERVRNQSLLGCFWSCLG